MQYTIKFVLSSATDNFSYKIAKMLAKSMGMPYTIMAPGPETLQNTTWNGPIGMLYRDEADVAVAPLMYTEERKTAIDFSFPFNIDAATFMTKKATNIADVSSLFRPFSLEVWIALILSSLSMSFILYGLLKKKCKFLHVLNNVVASLLQQSAKFQLERERWYMFTWFLGVMFLTSCYLSLLLSFLTFPPQNDVRDVATLANEVKNRRYQVVETNGALSQKLLESGDESLTIIGKNVLNNPSGYEDMEEFFFSNKPNRAFISSRSNLNIFKGKVFISDDYFFFYTMSFGVRKNFCCREKLDMAVHKITAAALYSTLIGEIRYDMSYAIFTDKRYKESNHVPLTIFHLEGAFIILGSGLTLSVFTLLIEVLFKRCTLIKRCSVGTVLMY